MNTEEELRDWLVTTIAEIEEMEYEDRFPRITVINFGAEGSR